MTTLRRLLSLARVPRKRVALTVLLGALTILFGVGLMATAGYLISRAAERPAILSLTVAIVGVRFFGLARPIARYLERLTSHDVAFRALGQARHRVYERIEPLAPAELRDDRQGDLLSRLVADVDSLQNLHLSGIGPPLVAVTAGAVSIGVAAAILPAAGLVLAIGLVTAGVAVPAVGALSARRSGREAAARGELTAELVEACARDRVTREHRDAVLVLDAVTDRRLDRPMVGGGRDDAHAVFREHDTAPDLDHVEERLPGEVRMVREAVLDVWLQHRAHPVDHFARARRPEDP